MRRDFLSPEASSTATIATGEKILQAQIALEVSQPNTIRTIGREHDPPSKDPTARAERLRLAAEAAAEEARSIEENGPLSTVGVRLPSPE